MYDYVIVGAGSAGCVLADRLSADQQARVLLLEAGPPDRKREIRIPAAFAKLFGSEVDWAFWSEPEPGLDGRRIFYPRGRTLGGSSSINAQMHVVGHRAAYDAWATAAGDPGWGWDSLQEELPGVEAALSVAPLREPNPLTKAFLAAADAARVSDVTQRDGRRWSVADAYLRGARRRRSLEVVTGAQVDRITFAGRRATGVAYRADGVARAASAAREVLVCAGAIGSPHLLMRSGIGPAEDLRAHGVEVVHDAPGVGRDLQDHVATGMFVATPRPVSLYSAETPRQIARYLSRRRGMLASNVGEAYALLRTRPELEAPDLELAFCPVLFQAQGLEPPARHGFTVAAVALAPHSRGSVTLRSADPDAPPAIRLGFCTDPDGEDMRVLVEGLRLARGIVAHPAFAPWRGEELGPGDCDVEAHVRATAHTLYHPVGTCPMGEVVDAALRVRGLAGLRVVDASAIPAIPGGHTNTPTVMLAERAARLIRAAARTEALVAA